MDLRKKSKSGAIYLSWCCDPYGQKMGWIWIAEVVVTNMFVGFGIGRINGPYGPVTNLGIGQLVVSCSLR